MTVVRVLTCTRSPLNIDIEFFPSLHGTQTESIPCLNTCAFQDLSGDRLAALIVTDRFIYSLRRFRLTELDISGCREVSEAGVLAAASLGA